MSDETCITCGKPILGGHDVALMLPSPVSSYHVPHHLDCLIRAEREACAKIADEHASHHATHGAMTDASIVNVVGAAIRSRGA